MVTMHKFFRQTIRIEISFQRQSALFNSIFLVSKVTEPDFALLITIGCEAVPVPAFY